MPQYQGIWTLPQAAQALTSGQWVTDPNFKNTTLLLQADGAANTSQNNTFLDSSTANSGVGFPITRNGNTTQGSFTPFSATGWGISSGSSSTDMLSTASNAAFAFGTGDFTMEAFVFATASQTDNWIIGLANNCWLRIGSAGKLEFYNNVTSTSTLASSAMALNQWVHVAVVRSGTALTIYENGISVATATVSTNFSTSVACTIGNQSGFDRRWNGYLSNVRVVKGTAVYTSAFTPPTTALTAITNTSLLTCQSNRFVDNSANAFALTVTGTPSVQPFSPFAPQYQYTPTVIGGSGYFDGTGDYLYAGNNAAFTMGTGDFTYECWVYHTSISGQQTYFARTNGNFNGVYFYKDSSGFPGVYYTAQVATSSVALTANQWYHLVASRLSGTLRIFVNGVQTASVANTTNLTESVCYVGGDSNATNPMIGYMSGCRILKGTGYSSITVPTAPLTAITNTSLLLNFTNAGIYDGTMKNDLETVGNAQISTAVVKYGSGSLYFDGTGDTLQIAPSVNALPINGNNFTIEFWYRFAVVPGTQYFYTQRVDGNNYIFIYATSTGWVFDTFSAAAQGPKITSSTITPDASNWHHFALVYLNGTYTMYVDGVSVGSQANSTVLTTLNSSVPTTPVYIGSRANIDSYVNGYLDDFRITKGLARYTQNFTPPLVALPRQ